MIRGEKQMDPRKITLYIILIVSIAAVIFQTPQFQAVGMGKHTFVSGSNVDCVSCHRYDAYQDMSTSQALMLDAHRRAAGNKNYTTYLEVGGISYDPSGIIYTSVDADGDGTSDIWTWDGSMWVHNGIAKLYDLDLNMDGSIEGSEICKLCHNLELMGVSSAVSEAHTVGTRYCDDDRCHGNRANQYNSYLLFAGNRNNVTSAGWTISNDNVHAGFYNEAAGKDAGNPIFFHSYGQVPGNAAPGNSINISESPYTCLGCHSHISVTGSVASSPKFNHLDPDAPRGRYT